MSSLHNRREMRRMRRDRTNEVNDMYRLSAREKFAFAVVGIVIFVIGACIVSANSQTIIQITQEQARVAIVKAVGMGYECRDRGVSLASCLTMAVSSISK